MPIGFDGQQYSSELEMLLGASTEAQEGSEDSSGTQIPISKNNAPAGSVEPSRGIPEEDNTLFKGTKLGKAFVNRTEDVIKGVAKSFWEGITAPGKALEGKLPMWAMDPETGEFNTSSQAIEKANDLAGVAVFGPAPVASKMAEGTLGSFMGVKSKTFDKSRLYKAQEMEFNGAHPDDIWKETQTFRGADNRWKQEVPNDKSNLKISGVEELGDLGIVGISKETTLDKVLHDPDLLRAYPHLKDIVVKNKPGLSGSAHYSSAENAIYISPAKPEQFLKTIQHEVQHAIQIHEGFGYGGNPRMFASPEYLNQKALFAQKMDKTFSDLKQRHPDYDFDSLRGSIEAKLNGNYESLNKPIQKSIDSRIEEAKKLGFYDTLEKYIKASKKIDELEAINYQKYRRLMGEVEARNVESRLDFTELERYLNSPHSTESVPRFLQTDPTALP